MLYNKFKSTRSRIIILCSSVSVVMYVVLCAAERAPAEARAPGPARPAPAPAPGPGPGAGAGGAAEDAGALRRRLRRRNRARRVRNEDTLGPVRADTPVVAVLAGRDLPRLRALAAGLARAPGLDSALLVFSHAYYSRAVDAAVRALDCCMVLQLFYPDSAQLRPALYARGAAAERKHHWWWTAHRAFRLAGRAPVLFLDERSAVLPDVAHVLAAAARARRSLPAAALWLGGPARAPAAPARLAAAWWRAPHASGLAFDADTWRQLAAHGRRFCSHADSSWARSLQHAARALPAGGLLALAAAVPRVVPADADAGAGAGAGGLFPRRVVVSALHARTGRVPPPRAPPAPVSGGWSAADRARCYDFSRREFPLIDLPLPLPTRT